MTTEQLLKPAAIIESKIDGVVIGLFLSITDAGEPLVAFPGNPLEAAIPARSTTALDKDDVGKEIALLFEGGNLLQPLIIGKIHHANTAPVVQDAEQTSAELDGEHIVLAAKQTITFKCGKASITLTKAGKIILRGAYLLSRSSGVNRIKGGSVQIN
ncbi:conserved hypothetical protein [Candidatus Methylobacter favarea]|uniref:DUF6484 domain-containing protein n=1 Tax=Candidatus Methylobacter favarea TaxID=2707345 RepID=A0A8S0X711_9GAMM|nr:DUF6484 domain-containing protein [Candidatus Methylobacter favarea]CAA9889675.1 conserved hypothetical protein [Candidatus Methylobacter favarea]